MIKIRTFTMIFRTFSFLLTVFLSSSLLLANFICANGDYDEHSEFLQDGLHSSAPPMKAVDEYKNSCVKPKGDRLIVFTPPESSHNKITFHKGSAFLATDLCPMGHTAKDAPLLMSWALDAEGFSRDELMKDVYRQNRKHIKVFRKDATEGNDSLRSPALTHIIFGNMCMSKDKKIVPNKRTPVFHNVLIHWFRAVKQRLLMLRRLRNQKSGDEEENSTQEIKEIHFVDIEQDKKEGMMCFENVVVRQERWRWLREQYHADQFRIAMWNYFNISDENQRKKLEIIKKGSNNGELMKASCGNVLANELLLSHLQPSKNSVMISQIESKLLGSPQQSDLHAKNLAYSLRSAFPSSLLPLRISILVRDEDRHFEEQKIAQFIESHFGGEKSNEEKQKVIINLVEVRQEKFDSLKGDAHYIPPTHKEQLQILFDTDILIAAHGAGLSSVLAMRPGTAVIEFFPHNFKYSMYEELAEVARVHYRRWESQLVWPKRCCSVSGSSRSAESAVFDKPMHLNGLGARACKKCDTYVNPELIEDLVGQALREVAISHL